jgi:hypothetical protein
VGIASWQMKMNSRVKKRNTIKDWQEKNNQNNRLNKTNSYYATRGTTRKVFD